MNQTAEMERPPTAFYDTAPAEARFEALKDVGLDDDALPQTSTFHRVATGSPVSIVATVAWTLGQKNHAWRDFGPWPTDGSERRMASESGWIAFVRTDGDAKRIRIFDADGQLASVVRNVPECPITASVHSVFVVEDIKRQWERNGNWDLSESVGFEAHALELQLHSGEWNDRLETVRLEERQRRVDAIAAEFDGLGHAVIAERILSIEERLENVSTRLARLEGF